jgi:DNA-binding response OmpR family regulator
MNSATILLVDDEPELRNALESGLKDRGFNIISAGDGLEALDILKTLKPNLIITDLKMLPMNGFDFYQNARKMKGLENIPFFFLTAIDDQLSKKYSKDLGVDTYITKPFDFDELELIINSKLSELK